MTTRAKVATAVMCSMALAACGRTGAPPAGNDATSPKTGPLQATYWIDDTPVTLREGRLERPVAPGSAAMERIAVLEGSQVHGDLDGDGDDDVALVLIQDSGGSGVFRHLAAALHGNARYEGSNTLFLGDRIGDPALRIHDGMIRVEFLDRAEGVPFSDPPTIERVVWARLAGRELREL